MTIGIPRHAVGATLVALGLFACNSVLGNDPGILDVDASVDAAAFDVVTSDVADSMPRIDAQPMSDAAPAVDSAPLADAGPTCSAGKKYCFGACVDTNDPLYGCATGVCMPCSLPRASATCAAGACTIGTCQAGYSDCDGNAATGCETDLSQPAHCGACNAVCPSGAPICSPSGATFACTTGCTAQAPTLCTNQCVDLATNATHCAGCNTVCPMPMNSVASCTQSQCSFACTTGFHKCTDHCASNVDPATCGSSCTACPSGANSTAGCNGTSCTLACSAGFADCDANPSNGCEVTLATDNANCGVCGRACTGASMCVSGACVWPPDASAPDSGAADASPADATDDGG